MEIDELIKYDLQKGLTVTWIAQKYGCSNEYVRWLQKGYGDVAFEMFDTFDNSDYRYIKEAKFKEAKLAEAKAELKYLDNKH